MVLWQFDVPAQEDAETVGQERVGGWWSTLIEAKRRKERTGVGLEVCGGIIRK